MKDIGQADKEYRKIIEKVLRDGLPDNPENVRPVYEDGESATTISVLNQQMKYDNSGDEALLLTSKRAPQKDPLIELNWIWRQMSNKVQDLRDAGCTVWDEWEQEDGTIGKAYGWQLGNKKRKVKIDKLLLDMFKNGELSITNDALSEEDWEEIYQKIEKGVEDTIMLNQVDYLLYSLKKNPYSRRILTTLYCVEDADDMALEPCVYETQWVAWNGVLNLTVGVRSNDLALGNGYNVYQYAVLHKQIAQVTGMVAGGLCINLAIPHLYERHIPNMLVQMDNPTHEPATLWINPEITSFYDFTIDDVKVENYKHSGTITYEIAI